MYNHVGRMYVSTDVLYASPSLHNDTQKQTPGELHYKQVGEKATVTFQREEYMVANALISDI